MAFEIKSFIKEFKQKSFVFSIFNMNISSLNKHHEDLHCLLCEMNFKFDIINLSEIRNINIDRYTNIFPNYSFLYKLPDSKKTGGIGVFVHDDTKFIVRNDLTINHKFIDILCFEIDVTQNKKILVISVYRHHSITIKDFQEIFCSFLYDLEKLTYPILILGDFNINLLDKKSNQIRDYYNETKSLGFNQLIKSPTRETQFSSTLIDHIYYKNVKTEQIYSGVLQTDISDHNSTFFLMEGSKPMLKEQRTSRRIFSKKNIEIFNKKLPIIVTDILSYLKVSRNSPAEDKWKHFISQITNSIEKNFQNVSISRKKLKDKPWINETIKKEIFLKERFYNRFINSKTNYQKDKYLNQKRKVRNLIYAAKQAYYENYLNRSENNCNIWKFISKCKNEGKNNVVKVLNIDHNDIKKPVDICNAFNNHFASIGSILESKINSNIDYRSFLGESSNTTFKLDLATKSDIKEIIKNLKYTSSVGVDEIHLIIIKENAEILSEPISILINSSIEEGSFPNIFKTAKIIPLHKKGSKGDVSNYRPISILSNLSKIYEKFICIQLTNYFHANNLFYEHQYGFRKFHNTTQALMSVNDLVINALGNKEKLMGVFLDLSKAFDTINVEILIHKMKMYGIRNTELNIINSFLTNRYQITFINNVFSQSTQLKTGIPQGSVLSPILFLIYVNDIKYFSSKSVLINLFADDTNIFVKSSTIADLFIQTNQLLENINEWFKSNKLSLNLNKTEYIVFGCSDEKGEGKLFIERNEIQKVNHTKYLGLRIEKRLKWNEAVYEKLTKINKLKYIFHQLKPYLGKLKLITLYKSLVVSNILYGIEIYGHCPDYLMNKIQRSQNYFLKLIFRKKRRYSTNALHKESQMLLIKDLFRQRLCLLIYDKLNNSEQSSYFRNIEITFKKHVHKYSTRRPHDIVIERCKGNRETIVNAAKLEWNSLPQFIREINDRKFFKAELEKYYMSKY